LSLPPVPVCFIRCKNSCNSPPIYQVLNSKASAIAVIFLTAASLARLYDAESRNGNPAVTGGQTPRYLPVMSSTPDIGLEPVVTGLLREIGKVFGIGWNGPL
jgi:hypothetical protein